MTASEQIDGIVAGLAGWRGAMLAQIRALIREAEPAATEQVKWRGAPVWSDHGDICVATVLKAKVKLTFPQGARLPDPARLFNNGLEGKHWRAIDIFEGDEIAVGPLKTLVRAAVAYNRERARTGATSADPRRGARGNRRR